jgi:hypothetical protein
MVYSRKIKKEKRRIDKLIHFCSKVNTFVNTRLTNDNTSSIIDRIDKIYNKIKHDNDFLDNLEISGINEISNKNTALYNSPFLPGHTMAFNGKKSVPVANPLGSATLGMVNSNQLQMSASAFANPAQVQAQNILSNGPLLESDEIDVLSMTPMAIDNRVSPAPPIVYPNNIIHTSRKSKYPPVSLPYGQMPTYLPPVAPNVQNVGFMPTMPVTGIYPSNIGVIDDVASFDALTIN